MKIAYFNGGLANQVFQYIFARCYELSFLGERMYLDDSWFYLNHQHNGYELESVFGLKPAFLSSCFTEDVWDFILEEKRKNGKHTATILHENGIPFSVVSEGENFARDFPGSVQLVPYAPYCPEILRLGGNVYYHGWWIDKRWFCSHREIFLEELSFPKLKDKKNLKYQARIRALPSVSLHVRRGDFITRGWAMEAAAVRERVDAFLEKYSGGWHLFIFSDDIPWVRAHRDELGLARFLSVTFVEGNMGGRNYIDLQLMCQCRAMINSNSSFCFLANLLNRNLN